MFSEERQSKVGIRAEFLSEDLFCSFSFNLKAMESLLEQFIEQLHVFESDINFTLECLIDVPIAKIYLFLFGEPHIR